MQREPPPFVWAVPDEKNILTCAYYHLFPGSVYLIPRLGNYLIVRSPQLHFPHTPVSLCFPDSEVLQTHPSREESTMEFCCFPRSTRSSRQGSRYVLATSHDGIMLIINPSRC